MMFVALVVATSTTNAATDTMRRGIHATGTHATSTRPMKDMVVKDETIRAARKAIENNDYEAFHKAVAKNEKAYAITQSQFDTLVAAEKILVDAGLAPRVIKPIIKPMKPRDGKGPKHATSTATSTRNR